MRSLGHGWTSSVTTKPLNYQQPIARRLFTTARRDNGLAAAGRSLSMQTSAAAVDVQQAPVVSQEQLQQGQEQGRQGRSHRRGSNGAGQQHGQGQQLQQQPLQLPEGVVVEEADTPVQATDYVFVDNLRLVRPYYFDFKCYVKQRWEGKTLVELFAEEFPLLTPEYYTKAFASGRLRVHTAQGAPLKGPPLTLQSKLKVSWCLRHFLHRHEPPVLAGKVQIVGQTPDYVAVVKPPCIPVHTVGQYRKNTVLGVLQAEHPELGHLFPTYRLDKPVSGLLLLARSTQAAGRMRKLLEERSCTKVYVARVLGRFPGSEAEVQALIEARPAGQAHGVRWVNSQQAAGSKDSGPDMAAAPAGPTPQEQREAQQQTGAKVEGAGANQGSGGSSSDDGAQVVEVDVSLTWDASTNHAAAVPKGSDPKAADAITHFRRLHYCPVTDTSVVECRPKTGRTHQIRVHLQYMGHPIANDTQYGGTWGAPLAFRRLHGYSAQAQQQQQQQGQQQQGRQQQDHVQGQGQGQQQEGQQQQQQAGGAGEGVQDDEVHAAKKPRISVEAEGADIGAAAGGVDVKQAARNSLISAALDVEGLPQAVQELYREPKFRVRPEDEDEVCPHCPCLVPRGYPIDLEPMWLHALKYSSSEWTFEAPMPDWAPEDYRLVPHPESKLAQSQRGSQGKQL